MAPLNLENNIREKLEDRELKPSLDAWAKLESRLDKEQPKKKTVIWYYVAASFIGVLILSAIFFTGTNIDENLKLVDENAKEIHIEKQSEIIVKPLFQERVVVEDVDKEIKTKKKPSKDDTKLIPSKASAVDRQILKGEVIAEVSETTQEALSVKAYIKNENQLLDEKASEVALQIRSLQDTNAEVTIEEVEALLENARRDIQAQRVLKSQKVDAMALLEEVEWELDKSFRDKVFDALGEGFHRLRTAISQRNN
ncbi:MAG TPA: hypothetical protein VKX34_06960 [Aequorivita sp.]|nr:hypothetical protein [Aequorivita sp.]